MEEEISDNLPLTLPLDSLSPPDLLANSQHDNIWGRLIPEPTNNGMQVIALKDSEYTFGRAPNCDVVLDGFNAKYLNALSKIHFKIINEPIKGSTSEINRVFIQDLSHNGTFVNNERIAKNKKIVLENDAIISLANPKLVAWNYIDQRLSTSEIQLPQRLRENYVVGKCIGTGASGEVRRIFSKVEGHMFALKSIAKKSLHTSEQVGLYVPRFMNEVEILKSLNHPFVVKFIDWEDTPSTLYIVLEYMRGGVLLDRILSNNRLSERTTQILMFQVFSAVQYMHSKNITHRDLKPENILLDSTDEITLAKISDFGLSKLVHSETMMLTICGTPIYVAPEIIENRSKFGSPYSSQVDIWSLGVILYGCLSGTLPFVPNNNNVPLYRQILKGKFTFPPTKFRGVSEEAKELIKSMMTVNPDERITIQGVMNHNWLKLPELKSEIQQLLYKHSANLNNENLDPSWNINSSQSPNSLLYPPKRPRYE